jgi:hypothetical protein
MAGEGFKAGFDSMEWPSPAPALFCCSCPIKPALRNVEDLPGTSLFVPGRATHLPIKASQVGDQQFNDWINRLLLVQVPRGWLLDHRARAGARAQAAC